jgi:hypothetical protein
MSGPPFDPRPGIGFGRIQKDDPGDANYPLREGVRRRGASLVPTRRSRRWRLLRRYQLFQGSTPQCVSHTGKHWERAHPTNKPTDLDPARLYALCKQRDGLPQADGTTGRAMLQVYQSLGRVENYFWASPGDPEAIWAWLMNVGSLWWGADWTESQLYPQADGFTAVEGVPQYGHETLILGGDRRTGLLDGVNSWGLDWGVQGRFKLRFSSLIWHLERGADLAGVVEKVA